MNHLTYCYECHAWQRLEMAGDLGQYIGDTIDCPCKQEIVTPKIINDDGDYGLFHVANLEPPSDTDVELLRHPKP